MSSSCLYQSLLLPTCKYMHPGSSHRPLTSRALVASRDFKMERGWPICFYSIYFWQFAQYKLPKSIFFLFFFFNGEGMRICLQEFCQQWIKINLLTVAQPELFQILTDLHVDHSGFTTSYNLWYVEIDNLYLLIKMMDGYTCISFFQIEISLVSYIQGRRKKID